MQTHWCIEDVARSKSSRPNHWRMFQRPHPKYEWCSFFCLASCQRIETTILGRIYSIQWSAPRNAPPDDEYSRAQRLISSPSILEVKKRQFIQFFHVARTTGGTLGVKSSTAGRHGNKRHKVKTAPSRRPSFDRFTRQVICQSADGKASTLHGGYL